MLRGIALHQQCDFLLDPVLISDNVHQLLMCPVFPQLDLFRPDGELEGFSNEACSLVPKILLQVLFLAALGMRKPMVGPYPDGFECPCLPYNAARCFAPLL